MTKRQKAYPHLLKEIHSPPKTLYAIGKLPADAPSIAIVGSRKMSAYGRGVTHRLAFELARSGVVIVSGLALGVDSIAHQAALEAGGQTVAVLACGLDLIYPASNRQLAHRIINKGGAVISEYPAGTPPLKQHFPARNRIISGLSLGVLVTEAAERSGALITANFALNDNRLVMAVPGNITSANHQGCNNLLKAGAAPITEAQDVLSGLGYESPQLKTNQPAPASKEESLLISLLASGLSDGEELLKKSGLDAAKFNQVITLMEISGKARNLGGGKWMAG